MYYIRAAESPRVGAKPTTHSHRHSRDLTTRILDNYFVWCGRVIPRRRNGGGRSFWAHGASGNVGNVTVGLRQSMRHYRLVMNQAILRVKLALGLGLNRRLKLGRRARTNAFFCRRVVFRVIY